MKFLEYPVIRTRDKKDSIAYWFDISSTEGQYKAVKVDVYYNLGGYGGFDWTYRERGYYVMIQPVTLTKTNYGWSEQSTLLGNNSGGYIFLEKTNRFNRKRLEAIQDLAQEKVNEYADKILAVNSK